MMQRKWFLLNFGFLGLIVMALIGLGTWFWYGSLEESVNGVGQMVPEGRLRKVMAPVNGIVAKVLVQEDQAVKAGQTLFVLDPEVNSIHQDMVMEELSLLQDESRALKAAYEGREATGVSAVQDAWVNATRQAEQSELASAMMQIRTAEHQYKESQERERHLKEVLASREKLLEQYHTLEQEGGLSRKELLTYEQAVLEQRGQLAEVREEVKARAIEYERSRQKPDNIKANFNKDVLSRLSDHQRQVVSLAGEAAKNRAVRKHELLVAPIDGVINEQAIHGPGEVVSAGSVLLSLVPKGGPLLAEVKVINRDLAYIHLGQRVELRLDSFPYQQFGRLSGKIVSISPSTVTDQEGNPYFLVRVKPEKLAMRSEEGQSYPIKSGMTVTADIIIREKNILSFFTEPIHYHFDRAFRDPTNR